MEKCLLQLTASNFSREIYNAVWSVTGQSISKLSWSKALFDIASLANLHIKYKINQLLGDKRYSSAKLEAPWFKAKKY